MKGKRRHDLEKNELADWLAKVIGGAKPFQNAVLAVVVLVVVAISVGVVLIQRSAGARTEAWDEFHRAFSELAEDNPGAVESLEDVAERHPGTQAAAWARILAGDIHLALGCEQLFIDKGAAKEELREATDHYLAILGDKRSSPEFRERATFGLARAFESEGKLKDAMENYEAIGRNWPKGAYAAEAASRLQDLQKKSTRELYDRFAKFDPKPVRPPEFDVPEQQVPFDFGALPDDGPLSGPDFLNLEEKGAADDQPPDDFQAPDVPAGIHPEGDQLEPTDVQPTEVQEPGAEPTDVEQPGAEAPGVEPPEAQPADAAAAAPEPTDIGQADPVDPPDPAEPPSEASQQP